MTDQTADRTGDRADARSGHEADAPSGRELVLSRLLDAPRENVFRCWVEPDLLRRWFVPRPWTITAVELDPRPGGASCITMRDTEGNDYPNHGVYLEVVPNERLVFTDAYREGWVPAEKPFFTAVVTFGDEGRGTRYTARVRHWTVEDRERHEAMGFHDGWGRAAAQLEEVAKAL